MKMTFQPKKKSRARVHGFRARMRTAGGRKVLAARRAKGRKQLSAQAAFSVAFLLLFTSISRIKIFSGLYWETGLIFCMKRISMLYSESLKKNKDFQNVYNTGKSYANKYLVMYIRKNSICRNRLGISVSKKVGNSVVRHRLTRLLRESYRLQEEHFLCGYDMIAVVRVNARNCTFADMESALIHLGKLHKIYKRM